MHLSTDLTEIFVQVLCFHLYLHVVFKEAIKQNYILKMHFAIVKSVIFIAGTVHGHDLSQSADTYSY